MFCGARRPTADPRPYGRGRVSSRATPSGKNPRRVPRQPGERSVVILEINRIADSCGFGGPVYYRHERTQLSDYARRKGPLALEKYRAEKNRKSIDGLDGLARLPGEE